VILSDVDGLFDKDPSNKDAHLIGEVTCVTDDVERMAGGSCSVLGTGGMSSKLQAAKKANAGGSACFIINGKKPGNITRLFDGEQVGTLIAPGKECMSSKKHWLAFSMRGKGRIVVDDGAAKAILTKGKSLLPSGVRAVEGQFNAGDAVEVCDLKGTVIARGLIHYSHEEVEKIKGVKSADIEQALGYKYCDEVIHRDDLVVI
jgi:glutamate 5-kinase